VSEATSSGRCHGATRSPTPLSAGRGRRRRTLFADAVLTYLRATATSIVMEQAFLELDRATLSVDRLVAELGRYADLHSARDPKGEPLWRRRYPSFPPVLCVLAGGSRKALGRRRQFALGLLRTDPQVEQAYGPQVYVCRLDDLANDGPFAPIFRGLTDPDRPIDWLGNSPDDDEREAPLEIPRRRS
jgi:hypothetical protein